MLRIWPHRRILAVNCRGQLPRSYRYVPQTSLSFVRISSFEAVSLDGEFEYLSDLETSHLLAVQDGADRLLGKTTRDRLSSNSSDLPASLLVAGSLVTQLIDVSATV